MATIYDIASKTGYSASTVARALSGKGYCSPRAKAVILRAAEEMAYVPHQAAKTLKNNITNKIMMCIPDIMNPYYFAMIHGAAVALERFGYNRARTAAYLEFDKSTLWRKMKKYNLLDETKRNK